MILPIVVLAMMQQPRVVEAGVILYQECMAVTRGIDDPAHATNHDLALAGQCAGYIQGVIDMQPDKVWRCNHGLPLMTIIRGYLSYMSENPKLMGAKASDGVTLTITTRFHCSSGPHD